MSAMSQLNGRDLSDTQPYLPAPSFPWKRSLGTQPRQRLQCGATVPAIPLSPSLGAWMPLKWHLCGISRSVCQMLGNPFLKVDQCWQRAMQDVGQGTLKPTAWEGPAPLLYPFFQRECSILSKYKKHFFLYQRGQIMGSNTCSLHVKVRCLIKQSP